MAWTSRESNPVEQWIICSTSEQWNKQLQKATDSKKLMVVQVAAWWCRPYTAVEPRLAKLPKKFVNVIFVYLKDCYSFGLIPIAWGMYGPHTFMFIKDGKLVARMERPTGEELELAIAMHAATFSP